MEFYCEHGGRLSTARVAEARNWTNRDSIAATNGIKIHLYFINA
jgi:hypothetical protein